jgi:hypothetical protein
MNSTSMIGQGRVIDGRSTQINKWTHTYYYNARL